MNRKRLLFVVAMICFVAAVAVLVREGRIARRAEAQTSELRRRQERLRADLKQGAHRSGEAPTSAAQAVGRAAAKESTRQQRRAATVHAWAELHNAALYRKLGLTAAQRQAFTNLEMGHWLRWADTLAVARAEGIPLSDPEIAELWKEETAQYQSEQTALLGQSAYGRMVEYERTSDIRNIATGLAGIVYSQESPMTADQGDQLTQILASNSASYQKGGPARFGDIDIQTALAQAKPILSPAQYEALSKSYLAIDALGTLQKLVQQAQAAKK